MVRTEVLAIIAAWVAGLSWVVPEDAFRPDDGGAPRGQILFDRTPRGSLFESGSLGVPEER